LSNLSGIFEQRTGLLLREEKMHYIRKLPLLFALFAAIIAGIIGLSRSMANDRIMLYMIISMTVFYAVGFIARYNLVQIYNHVIEKRQKETLDAEQNGENNVENVNSKEEEKENNVIDFEPLKVSRIIREELKESGK